MNRMRYKLFFMIFVSAIGTVAVTESTSKVTTADIARDVEQIYKKVFLGRNLVASNFSSDMYEPWFYVLTTLSEWINQLLAVERSFGSRISARNKEVIVTSMAQIKIVSEKLIFTIKTLNDLAKRNKQFTPPIPVFRHAQGDIKELENAYGFTLTLQKDLAPGLLDVRDTLDMKTILKKIFSLLSAAIKKISDDVVAFDKHAM